VLSGAPSLLSLAFTDGSNCSECLEMGAIPHGLLAIVATAILAIER